MRNTTFSRLALFGLAAVSSFAFAANTVMGEVRFDGRFTTTQKAADGSSVADNVKKADNLYISRARLDFAGDIAKSWAWGVRAEYNEFENAQNEINYETVSGTSLPTLSDSAQVQSISSVFSRAYATWTGLEGVSISLGRIGAPEISADHLYYKPGIGAYLTHKNVGNIVDRSGDHAGMSVEGKAGPVGYSFGVWKQTDYRKLESFTSATPSGNTMSSLVGANEELLATVAAGNFDDKSLRLGYAGRLTFAPAMSGGTSYGVGLGYRQAPLNMPVAIGTVQTFSGSSATGVYTLASFNNMTTVTADAAAVFGAVQVNVGFAMSDMKYDTATAYGSTSAASQVFNHSGKANAWWVEAGYLLMGDSYKFDSSKAVVSGVKLRENQAGLEIVARFGTEHRKNALALVNATGFKDFSSNTSSSDAAALSTANINAQVVNVGTNDNCLLIAVDNTGANGTQLVIDDETSFATKTTGYGLSVNYYITENAVLKAEFEHKNNSFIREYSSATWHDSLNEKNVSTIRVRAEFMF